MELDEINVRMCCVAVCITISWDYNCLCSPWGTGQFLFHLHFLGLAQCLPEGMLNKYLMDGYLICKEGLNIVHCTYVYHSNLLNIKIRIKHSHVLFLSSFPLKYFFSFSFVFVCCSGWPGTHSNPECWAYRHELPCPVFSQMLQADVHGLCWGPHGQKYIAHEANSTRWIKTHNRLLLYTSRTPDGGSQMAQWVKESAAQPDDQSSIPRTHMEKEWLTYPSCT